MNPLVLKWLGPVGVGVAGIVAALYFRASAASARGERDVAKVELVGLRAAFDGEKASTGAAADAAARCEANGQESDARAARALASLRSDLDRARVQLRACVSPEAVADRMGSLFPAVTQ